jgi:hypothetical protein
VIAGLVDAFRDLGCLEADSILVVRVSTLFCQPGFEVTLYGIGLYTFVAIRGLSIKVRLNVYYQAQARSIQSSRNSWSLLHSRADFVSKPDTQSHDSKRNSGIHPLNTIPRPFPCPHAFLKITQTKSQTEHGNRNLNASHPLHSGYCYGIMQEAALCTPAVYAILRMIEAVNFDRYEDDEH